VSGRGCAGHPKKRNPKFSNEYRIPLNKEIKTMNTNLTITAHGTLAENSDTFFQIVSQQFILLDTEFRIDPLLAQSVSVIGRMVIQVADQD
jgi:hypothetical protein